MVFFGQRCIKIKSAILCIHSNTHLYSSQSPANRYENSKGLNWLEIYCILKCICNRVCPNLICQYVRFSPGFSLLDFCVPRLPPPFYPTLHLQNHGHFPKAQSLQFHPTVICYQLSAISYLWMSLDITNQGATGQQQTSMLLQVLSLIQTRIFQMATSW